MDQTGLGKVLLSSSFPMFLVRILSIQMPGAEKRTAELLPEWPLVYPEAVVLLNDIGSVAVKDRSTIENLLELAVIETVSNLLDGQCIIEILRGERERERGREKEREREHEKIHTGRHTHTHTRACRHTHTHAGTHTHTHACTHTHARTHTHACMHTHTHARTHHHHRTHARTHTCTRTQARHHKAMFFYWACVHLFFSWHSNFVHFSALFFCDCSPWSYKSFLFCHWCFVMSRFERLTSSIPSQRRSSHLLSCIPRSQRASLFRWWAFSHWPFTLPWHSAAVSRQTLQASSTESGIHTLTDFCEITLYMNWDCVLGIFFCSIFLIYPLCFSSHSQQRTFCLDQQIRFLLDEKSRQSLGLVEKQEAAYRLMLEKSQEAQLKAADVLAEVRQWSHLSA